MITAILHANTTAIMFIKTNIATSLQSLLCFEIYTVLQLQFWIVGTAVVANDSYAFVVLLIIIYFLHFNILRQYIYVCFSLFK